MNNPIPPDLPIAIAIIDSVTVSIADDKKGVFNLIFLVRFTVIFVSEGKTLEKNVAVIKHHQKLMLL